MKCWQKLFWLSKLETPWLHTLFSDLSWMSISLVSPLLIDNLWSKSPRNKKPHSAYQNFNPHLRQKFHRFQSNYSLLLIYSKSFKVLLIFTQPVNKISTQSYKNLSNLEMLLSTKPTKTYWLKSTMSKFRIRNKTLSSFRIKNKTLTLSLKSTCWMELKTALGATYLKASPTLKK